MFSIPENAVYSGSGEKIKVEVIDTLSGPDNKNSSVRMFLDVSTIEGYCQSGDSAGEIFFIPGRALSDGVYKMEIIPRDLAGNTGKKIQISVIVDSVKPVITLSQELPQTSEKSSLYISGKVDKPNIKKISATMNSVPLKDIPLTGGNFSSGLALEKGLNKLTILAQDKAGNTARVSKTINCTAASTRAFFKFDGKNISDNDFVSETPSVKATDSSGAAFAASSAKLDSSSVPYDSLTGNVTLGTLSSGKHELLL
ncbi:MAG: Ig-like domain-containing protein, partial [Candidatus Margulisiibacteriota bacterium]